MAGRLAVVLSGGGAKGAFQVGALDQLITKHRVKFDIAVGTSTGSIQAAAVAQDDIPRLVRTWEGIKGDEDIYKKRSGTLIAVITGQPSIYNAAPLRRLLAANIDEAKIRASGKSLRLGVVSLTSGQFRSIAENASNIADYVYASCAMPFAFEPLQDAAKEQWVDGGVRDVTPLDAALELAPRAVLVIRASPPPQPDERRRYKDLVAIGLRAVDILQSEVSLNDLKNVHLINALLTARDRQQVELGRLGITGANADKVLNPLRVELAKYRMARVEVLEPAAEYLDTLEFDPVKIKAAIQAGRDAVEANWDRIEALIAG
jgi:NTE family protein